MKAVFRAFLSPKWPTKISSRTHSNNYTNGQSNSPVATCYLPLSTQHLLEYSVKLSSVPHGLHCQEVFLVVDLLLPGLLQHQVGCLPWRKKIDRTQLASTFSVAYFFSASSFCFLLHSLSNSSCLLLAFRASCSRIQIIIRYTFLI